MKCYMKTMIWEKIISQYSYFLLDIFEKERTESKNKPESFAVRT